MEARIPNPKEVKDKRIRQEMGIYEKEYNRLFKMGDKLAKLQDKVIDLEDLIADGLDEIQARIWNLKEKA
jgi:hypothetical protein